MAGEGAVSSYVLAQDLDRAHGRVHSVFRSSLNVLVNGFLLHIGSLSDPLSCLGIAIPASDMRELLGKARTGDLVFLSGGIMRIYVRAGVVRVGYGGLGLVDTGIPRLGDDWREDILRRAIAPIDFCGKVGLPASQGLARALRNLSCAALGAEGTPSVQAAAQFLIGRGLGLTPSGDDLLAGYGIALWARSHEDLLAGLRAQGLPGCTTDVSAAYLRAMAEGHANAAFIDLVRSLRAGDEALCRNAVSEICSVGHTSGHDSLLGFVVGMGLLECVGGPERFACESRIDRIAS